PRICTWYAFYNDMPSNLKPGTSVETTASKSVGLIPDRPRGGLGGPQTASFTPERRGRAVYEQSCQICHGPDLKGDRGPQVDNAISRLGADATRTVVTKGKGAMPPIASLAPALLDDLIAFLTKPESAPPRTAPP